MEITDINSAISFINTHIDYEKKDKLPYKEKFSYEFIVKFLEKLDIDPDNFKIVHVAGTNGKGSIVTILSHLISDSGFTVGAFLSPHIFSLNERINIDKNPIRNDLLIKSTRIYEKESKYFLYKASFFEVLTLIALISFSLSKCEYIILETGIGGRLDTTNFSEKKVAIISTIDYDHTETLGKNVKEIANEKAGIIKNKNIVIAGKQRKNVYNLIRSKSIRSNAKLYSYGKDFFISDLSCHKNGIIFSVYFDSETLFKIKAPLLSIHQALNIAISLQTLKVLNIPFTEASINLSLKPISLFGRFQYIFKHCHIILDGAHNIHSIKSLIINLRIRYKSSINKYLILSVSKGKDYMTIIEIIKNIFDCIIICPLPVKIKKDISGNVFTELVKVHKKTYYKNSIEEAYEFMRILLKKDDILVVTGSFYLIGEAFNIINFFD